MIIKLYNIFFTRLLRFGIFFLPFFLPLNGKSYKSDAFFNKEIELYSKGLYNDAIAYLEKVVELDQKEIPQDSERYGYEPVWLARCYYKLGDIDKTLNISHYYFLFELIDIRLTINSDNEADLAIQCQQTGNVEEAIFQNI